MYSQILVFSKNEWAWALVQQEGEVLQYRPTDKHIVGFADYNKNIKYWKPNSLN